MMIKLRVASLGLVNPKVSGYPVDPPSIYEVRISRQRVILFVQTTPPPPSSLSSHHTSHFTLRNRVIGG